MPNCYSLTRKGETEPSMLQHVDEDLCKHWEVDPHPMHWYFDWHNIIGFRLALGKTFAEIHAEMLAHATTYNDECYYRLADITRYLEEHYTSNAWAQR